MSKGMGGKDLPKIRDEKPFFYDAVLNVGKKRRNTLKANKC